MTVPLNAPTSTDTERLKYYLTVQGITDKRIRMALLHAAIDAERAVLRMARKQGIGAQFQRAQYNRVRVQLKQLISALFQKQIRPLLEEGRLLAVEAAARASNKALQPFLKTVFPNTFARKGFEDAFVAQARRSINTMMTRVQGQSHVPLAKSVYKSEALAKGWVDRKVNSALARGDSARQIADEVRSSIDPGVRGGVSYAAFRLGRTEINNAFHAQSVAQAQDSPWVADMEWHLSKTHKPDPGDLCEEYAAQRDYPKDAVPLKPHPQCKCFITPKMISWASFRENLLAGEYGSAEDVAA